MITKDMKNPGEVAETILSKANISWEDIKKAQRDIPVTIDIMRDRLGKMHIGYKEDMNYVLSILIPAKQYEIVDTGLKDEFGNPVLEKKEKPLQKEQVKILIWEE